MIAVLRNCIHGSNIVLSLQMDSCGNPQTVLKSSSSADGIEDLKRERNGLLWYISKTGIPINITSHSLRKEYFSIQISYISGRKGNYRGGLSKNLSVIEKVLQHYCEIWKQGAASSSYLGALHGDLSLDNILFQNSSPVFLDWEHFKPNGCPVGFDFLYFIFELLWFDFENRIKANLETFSYLRKLLKTLDQRGCLHPNFKVNPLEQTISFMRTNQHLWGSQILLFEKKFPILSYKAETISLIDQALANGKL